MNKLMLAVAAAVAIAAGVWIGTVTQSDKNTHTLQPPLVQGAIFNQPRPVTHFELVTSNNTPFTIDKLKGHWNLIFVGYTNCPDVCPTTLNVLSQVVGLMEEQGLAPPRVIFISIDPERDKPEMIDEYVKYFDSKFIGLTGSQQQLDEVARELSVVYAKAPGADGSMTADNYLMDHSSSIIMLNPDAQVQAIYTAPHTPMKIIDAIVKTQVYYYE